MKKRTTGLEPATLIQAERRAGEADLLVLMARRLTSVYQRAFAAAETAGELAPRGIVIVDVDEEENGDP